MVEGWAPRATEAGARRHHQTRRARARRSQSRTDAAGRPVWSRLADGTERRARYHAGGALAAIELTTPDGALVSTPIVDELARDAHGRIASARLGDAWKGSNHNRAMTPNEIESAANLGRTGLLVDVRPLLRFPGCVVESWLLPWGAAEVRYNWYDFDEDQLCDEGEIVFRAKYSSVLAAAEALSRHLKLPFKSWRNLVTAGWRATRSDWPSVIGSSSRSDDYRRLLADFQVRYPPLPEGEWRLVK